MSETRAMHCDACGGDGGFDDQVGRDPDGIVFAWFRCSACDGRGEVEVEMFPVTLDDLVATEETE